LVAFYQRLVVKAFWVVARNPKAKELERIFFIFVNKRIESFSGGELFSSLPLGCKSKLHQQLRYISVSYWPHRHLGISTSGFAQDQGC
jgi:hypothetical protein